MEYLNPQNVTEPQRFLGMVNWYHKLVPCFADIADPLYTLLKKKGMREWTRAPTQLHP